MDKGRQLDRQLAEQTTLQQRLPVLSEQTGFGTDDEDYAVPSEARRAIVG